MKKSSIVFKVFAVLLLSLFFSPLAFGQSTVEKTISLSVKGIEYDDPGFVALKDNIKTKNVKNIQQTFNEGTGKISFSFRGSATDFWDGLSPTIKQPFKVTSIDANNIGLQLKNANQQEEIKNVPPNNKNTAANEKKADACTTCYIDLCKYDQVKTFQGIPWYGINYDEGTYYYRCENDMLIRKQIWVNENGVTTKIVTDTILYVNRPEGYSWGWRTENNTDYAMDMRTIVAKNVTVQIEGKIYKDVIVVNRKTANSNNAMRLNTVLEQMIAKESGTSINAYYYRGASIAKIQTVGLNTDPLVALKQYQVGTTPDNQPTNVVTQANANLKGKVDPTIVGIWKSDDEGTKASYYKFNANGSAEFYVDGAAYSSGKKKICQWRLDGNFMEFMCDGATKVERLEIHKGKGCLLQDDLSCLGINGKIYLRTDGKKVAW